MGKNIGSGGSFNMEGNGVSTLYCATLAGLVKFAAKQQLGKCSRSTRPEHNYAHFPTTRGPLPNRQPTKEVVLGLLLLYFLFSWYRDVQLGFTEGRPGLAEQETSREPPSPPTPNPPSPHIKAALVFSDPRRSDEVRAANKRTAMSGKCAIGGDALLS